MKRYKQAESFLQYQQIMRKYWRRHEYWRDRDGKPHNLWAKEFLINIWVYYRFLNVESAQEALRHPKYTHGNLKLILNEFIRDFHKKCYLENSKDKEIGILYGVEATNEDYYWMVQYPNGKIRYESCVGGYELVEE